MLVFSVVFRYAVSSKDNLLLANGYGELKMSTSNILSSKNLMYEKFVYDNSYWSELMNATSKKDTNWITTNFVPSFSNDYNFDYLWILNESNELIFNKNTKDYRTVSLFDVNKNDLLTSLEKNHFKKFYTNFENTTTQIIIAPIHPTKDPRRISKPKGYLICGKRYDSSFINEFIKVSPNTLFSITNEKNKDSIDSKNYFATYRQRLYDF